MDWADTIQRQEHTPTQLFFVVSPFVLSVFYSLPEHHSDTFLTHGAKLLISFQCKCCELICRTLNRQWKVPWHQSSTLSSGNWALFLQPIQNVFHVILKEVYMPFLNI